MPSVLKSRNHSTGGAPPGGAARRRRVQRPPEKTPRRVREVRNPVNTVLEPSEEVTGTQTEDSIGITTPQPSSLYTTPTPFSSYGMMGATLPYYGGGAGGMMGPFSGLHQVLFGVQNVIFSVTQAVQLMGTNQQALQLAFDSVTKMVDSAIATFCELRALEAQREYTPEQQRQRKRLRALRWAMVMGGSWLVYRVVRRITSKRKRLSNTFPHLASSFGGAMIPYQQPPYGRYGMMGGPPALGGSFGLYGSGVTDSGGYSL